MLDAAQLVRPAAPGASTPVTLVVFDCDGVLIDSEILVCRLTAEELTRLGFPIGIEEVIERFAGRPEREMVAEIARDWGRPVPDAYFAAMRTRTEQVYASELQIMPGIADALTRMRAAICVASSSHPTKLADGLRSVGLYDRFAPNIVSASSVAHGKPAPDVFIYALGWMRRTTRECVVIEDSVPGVQAAVAAGLRTFGFTGGSHCRPGHRDRLLAAGAERVFADFAELDALAPSAF